MIRVNPIEGGGQDGHARRASWARRRYIKGHWKRRLSANETNKPRPDMASLAWLPKIRGLMYHTRSMGPSLHGGEQKHRNGQSLMEGDMQRLIRMPRLGANQWY